MSHRRHITTLQKLFAFTELRTLVSWSFSLLTEGLERALIDLHEGLFSDQIHRPGVLRPHIGKDVATLRAWRHVGMGTAEVWQVKVLAVGRIQRRQAVFDRLVVVFGLLRADRTNKVARGVKAGFSWISALE